MVTLTDQLIPKPNRMKHSENPSGKFQPTQLLVNARFDHSWFLSDMVEELANEKATSIEGNSNIVNEWHATPTSSIEAGVSGNFIFSDQDLHLHFTTGFVFICTHGENGKSKLTWSNSLS